ncbi:NGG1p interacting factor NIF3 [Moraxella sp.]|uniref:NGG1p interacting factor NIF3 n=1 Tax=Moraxella sp. TaxID=479 RepID=UPI002623B21B|nr:NGG1p interacting factor NIF3 [Moraxella sp.]MCP3896845.1 NGG1p interacting factor NIF3 [Moraxella sp.]
MVNKFYKFIGYIPETDLEKVKTALFKAGAGQLGGYSHCSWQVLGLGQFKPLKGADPAIGEIDKIEYVSEWRVETVVPADKLSAVVASYKQAHPYEVPAYEVYEMIDI